jgi:hypothetical protein
MPSPPSPLCSSTGSMCRDLPALAMQEHPEVYRSLASLLRTTEFHQSAEVALDTTGELLTQLNRALRGATDVPSCTPVAEPAATSVPERAPTSAACSTSHRQGQGKAELWTTWRVADLLWLSITPVLHHRSAAAHAIPILCRILPLLCHPSSDGEGGELAYTHAAILWRNYFEVLLAVLRSRRLM